MSEDSIEMLVVTLLFDGESTPNPTEVGPQSSALYPLSPPTGLNHDDARANRGPLSAPTTHRT